MVLFTPALAVYALAAFVANIYMGVCGFGSGIIMVLGWQIANMLQLEGTVRMRSGDHSPPPCPWLAVSPIGAAAS